ncbi:MAG: hypothetical protein JXQ90_13380 [Cyclobacteriaceae bacterium]
MKIDRNVSKSLAQSALVMNVIDGGMSKPNIKLKKRSNHYLLAVTAPGVDFEAISIEVDRSELFIYQDVILGTEMTIPFMMERMVIPADVQFNAITASYVDGRLSVILPFNEMASGFHKEIEIERR